MIIDRYDMQIYPRKLWVATGWGKEVTSRFKNIDGSELEDVSSKAYAETYDVEDKRSGHYGILIVFNDIGDRNGSQIVKDISHESVHAMTRLFRVASIFPDIDNDEPMAYLVGWAAQCCWKTLQKIVYKDKKKKKK